MAPVFTIGNEMIITAAPPERAGAASALSETSAEFSGALGIAVFGSLGTALYRDGLGEAMPAGVSPGLADQALATLGGAVSAASALPEPLGEALPAPRGRLRRCLAGGGRRGGRDHGRVLSVRILATAGRTRLGRGRRMRDSRSCSPLHVRSLRAELTLAPCALGATRGASLRAALGVERRRDRFAPCGLVPFGLVVQRGKPSLPANSIHGPPYPLHL